MGKEKNEMMEGYKETEIGVLPADWEVVRLGEIALLIRGISWKKNEEASNGIPVIAIPNINNGKVDYNVRYRIAKKVSAIKLLSSNDILLVGSSGSIENVGRTAMISELPFEKTTFASFLVKLAPLEKVNRYFLYFLCNGRIIDFGACSKRAADGKYNLQIETLKDYLIPLPPLSEQRRIAHVLSTIQRAIELQDKVISALRELKKSLMRHLFTYGPVPVDQIDRVPLKETEIGMVPEHWEVVRLGETIINTQYGLSLRGSTNGKYPILRMNNLIEGSINTSDLQYVNLELEQLERFRLNKGDILFNRTNSFELVGKTSLFALEGDFVFASYLIRIITNKMRLTSWFLNYYFNWDETQRRLKLLASRGVSQSNISATKLKGFVIPLPPLPEQHQIAHILTTVDNKIEAEQQRKSALQTLFQTMLHLLMTGRVRVKDLEVNEDAPGR